MRPICYLYFNSIKVQLEHVRNLTKQIFYLFQFHKGTIRTGSPGVKVRAYFYFNSIKVQLELIIYREKIKRCHHFNSIKVQLERRLANCCQFLLRFQFHKGTIRTIHLLIMMFLFANFNSIKVQLELIEMRNGSLSNLFQFHKGTIRTRFCPL